MPASPRSLTAAALLSPEFDQTFVKQTYSIFNLRAVPKSRNGGICLEGLESVDCGGGRNRSFDVLDGAIDCAQRAYCAAGAHAFTSGTAGRLGSGSSQCFGSVWPLREGRRRHSYLQIQRACEGRS